MQHWNSYWSSTKSLNSFAEGEHSQGYVGEIADFWQMIFSGAPTPANILDLATGNGALAFMAQEFNQKFNIFASDAANIDPLSIYNSSNPIHHQLKKIHFHGNMPSENLAFDDDSFNLVISQFGFEYAETSIALQEVNRVLHHGGEFVALVHHKDSFISQDCQVGLRVLESFHQVDGLLSLLKDFGDFCQSIKNKNMLTSDQQVEFKNKNASLLRSFKQKQTECKTEHELDWYNLLAKELLPLIMDWHNTDSKRVIKVCNSLHSFQLRLLDQQIASWSKSDIENIKSFTHKSWSSCEYKALYLGDEILCWVFRVLK